MRANLLGEEENNAFIEKLCYFVDHINQSINSLDKTFCTKTFLMELVPNIPLAVVLFSKVEFRAVKVIDIKFPINKLETLVHNGQLCKNTNDLTDLLDDSNEKFNIITHGIRDNERRFISICCINYNSEIHLDSSWSLLKILAPHLHVAITNNYHKEQLESSSQQKLTSRELEILWWVSKGKTNYEIGMILNISSFTVKNHVSNILFKLQVSNRAQALEKALSLGYFWN